MASPFTKEGFARLTASERHEFMALQMSPSYTSYGGYLPDDCSECGACGQPILGSGWCTTCGNKHSALLKKMEEAHDAPADE